MLNEIPSSRPVTTLLDSIDDPSQLRELDEEQLPQLANELRDFMLYSVGQTGGHFGSGLGVVELTVALHYLYNTPHDRIVWDVGHQSYPHKILTGRREQMLQMRMHGGLAGFPKRSESQYDAFGAGHSSTSISAALGMAIAARHQGIDRKSVAVIGDGAMTAGMAFEALNHAAHSDANILVILNDNGMSISHNTGGLSTYFSKIWASKTYTEFRAGSKKVLSKISAWEFARRLEEHVKGMVGPSTLFEELGFNYIGPIDGHNLPNLVKTIGNMRDLDGPQFLHIMTKKGKGCAAAEEDPVSYHAINKIEIKPLESASPQVTSPQAQLADNDPKPKPKYQQVFGDWLCDMAQESDLLIGITPAMGEGSGMIEFSERFPDRYHDVAIAEQHAVTLAAGMACEGLKPVVAIYSTFLQRAYDQLIHDVAIQNLDVLFGIDRAGLVGEDGPTHAGSFDLSFLRCIPNLIVMTPSDENETRQLLYTGYQYNGPAAVRYPRGQGPGTPIEAKMTALQIGRGIVRRRGDRVAILNFGTLMADAMTAAEKLDATVADMRFVKPLDEDLIIELANSHDLLVTVEENTVAGGAGASISEFLCAQNMTLPVLHLGLPDKFVDQGKHQDMLQACGLDSSGIEQAIFDRMQSMQLEIRKSL